MKGDKLNLVPSWPNLTILDLIIDDFLFKQWDISEPSAIAELESRMNGIIAERNSMYEILMQGEGN